MPKSECGIDKLINVQKFFYQSLTCGNTVVIESLKQYLFQGFEWNETIKSVKTNSIENITFDVTTNNIKSRNIFEKLKEIYFISKCILRGN